MEVSRSSTTLPTTSIQEQMESAGKGIECCELRELELSKVLAQLSIIRSAAWWSLRLVRRRISPNTSEHGEQVVFNLTNDAYALPSVDPDNCRNSFEQSQDCLIRKNISFPDNDYFPELAQ
jgi:hypothetical protein